MALGVKFECCAKRFLSPTRFLSQTGSKNGMHQDNPGKTSVGVASTSFTPDMSNKNLVVVQMWRNKSSSLSVKNLVPGVKNVLSTVKNAGDSLRDFKDKSSPSAIKDKMSSLFSAYNRDVPQKVMLGTNSSEREFHNDSMGDMKLNLKEEHELEHDMDYQLQLEKKNDQIYMEREWHDLHEAMAHKFRSVSAFCSEASNKEQSSNITTSENHTSVDESPSSVQVVVAEEETEKPPVSGMWSRIYSNLPNIDLRVRLPVRKDTKTDKNAIKPVKKLSKAAINSRTRSLTKSLKSARSNISKLVRLEDLSKHLHEFPEAKVVTIQEEVIPVLLMLRNSSDIVTREQTRELLAQLGYIDPVKGRGIRILTLDGGGTRGLISIQMLRELEKKCDQNICEMFDYICGVSTGSLIATLLAVHKIPLSKCEEIYKEFSKKVFDRTRTAGAVNLVTSHAYYDAVVWQDVLKSEIGEMTFSETARDADCPKLSAVSAVVNVERIQNYLFRNYEYPEGMSSNYDGSMQHKLWHGIKASSAAPGYFAECKFGDYVHQDGGLLTNNPTAIAIHESQLLWPQTPIQCVVSVGNGKYEPVTGHHRDPNFSSLKNKLLKIVQSATDTEAVHSTMLDLLPASYFRFNPFISEDFLLDEVREEKWDVMYKETEDYMKRNQLKFQTAAEVLQKAKLPHQKMTDWLYLKSNQHNLPNKVFPKSKKNQK